MSSPGSTNGRLSGEAPSLLSCFTTLSAMTTTKKQPLVALTMEILVTWRSQTPLQTYRYIRVMYTYAGT